MAMALTIMGHDPTRRCQVGGHGASGWSAEAAVRSFRQCAAIPDWYPLPMATKVVQPATSDKFKKAKNGCIKVYKFAIILLFVLAVPVFKNFVLLFCGKWLSQKFSLAGEAQLHGDHPKLIHPDGEWMWRFSSDRGRAMQSMFGVQYVYWLDIPNWVTYQTDWECKLERENFFKRPGLNRKKVRFTSNRGLVLSSCSNPAAVAMIAVGFPW